MAGALQGRLLRAWTGKGPLACALLPVAAFFGALAAVRRQCFRWHWLPSRRVDAFVLVVGNVVAGGAGKTPTAIALVRHLQGQGHCVGVVSRGYGRTSAREVQACVAVTAASTAQEVGDEPLLISHATGVPVFVARDRYLAARTLMAQHPKTDVIVCDDGLQHYGLFRDLDICVFDDRGCGNGWLLPAGPLRESWPRRGVAAAGQSAHSLLVLNTSGTSAPGQWSARRALCTLARDRHGSSTPLSALNAPGRPPVAAVAGIARPEVFFSMLRETGLVLARTQALPDHFDFRQADTAFWSEMQLVCTEKDAPKLWAIAPSALSVALEQTLEPAFLAEVDRRITAHCAARQAARLSSRHGH